MTNTVSPRDPGGSHNHIFLSPGHERNERKTWAVIWLCGIMMAAEIIGGSLFGSLALVADGLHMSTHAGALLIAALAYTYARRHADDSRFGFGTGKLGDLAGFTSAIVLAMIALLIGYEAAVRLLNPVQINFNEAIPIAVVGLVVNIASAWLLSGGEHGHEHGHSHGHSHDHAHGHAHGGEGHASEAQLILTSRGVAELEIFEDGVPPCFRLRFEEDVASAAVSIVTERADGALQTFGFTDRCGYLESEQEIPEPHEFKATLLVDGTEHHFSFTEHAHAAPGAGVPAGTHRDNNMRAAYVHVLADAAVSVLAIIGLSLGREFGWVWMDPMAGVVGALVIANWSYRLIGDTGGILLDMNPDRQLADKVRKAIEIDGDDLLDLHLWRLGPGHLGAILSVRTAQERDVTFYRKRLGRFESLSHVTVEIQRATQ